MGKKKRKVKKKPVKTSLKELEKSRTGGQIALSGFTYQFLYSSFLILSEVDKNTSFLLEGIEDIDKYKCEIKSNSITHIQLKYSTVKQDASFLTDVLKNYLEAYLIDKTHSFKLVYDFDVSKGNLSKLFDDKLDESSKKRWREKIDNIKTANSNWNWQGFSFEDFIGKLSFERVSKDQLTFEIEKLLIEKYEILNDNISLYANGINILCLEKMEKRESINKFELNSIIQEIKDDINKGVENEAHKWIKKIDFEVSTGSDGKSFFEGKKATPQDIAMELPIRRLGLEKEIAESIISNRVTVIKSSSGQGKTTIALQVAHNLSKEYTIYQLLWCNDVKELDSIMQYFKNRIKLGEKPLVIIDNLDSQLIEWNKLAQLMQEDISYNYKLLLTSREDDWYSYAGNLSNVQSLKTIKLLLSEDEAENIFKVLRDANKLHTSVSDWRKSWNHLADKKLLIEYIYLLTHGEMISERVAHQISEINKTETGRIKCEILRKVCFADICGIKIAAPKLIRSLIEDTSADYGEILKSIENEFLIRVDSEDKYIEGLHPVRSQHIVDRLHEYVVIEDTANKVVMITDIRYFSKLFSTLPQFISNKSTFYPKVVENIMTFDELSLYLTALRGLLLGSVMNYYLQNKESFDDANNHGGLFIFSTELNPFTKFDDFDFQVNILDEMKKTDPENSNIQYLCDLRDSVPKIVVSEMDIYFFCEALFSKLKDMNMPNDISAYSPIAYWLINIDKRFNLSSSIDLNEIWLNIDNHESDDVSNLMYTCFLSNKDKFSSFVGNNIDIIVSYLIKSTDSLELNVNDKDKRIHVKYLLSLNDVKKANEESVSRLKIICKTLPIYELYCADAIKPSLDILSGYKIPDDAHKAMPIKNIVMMFKQDFTSLWNKAIMSNYECDSVYEWLEHWFSVRKKINSIMRKCVYFICNVLGSKPQGSIPNEIGFLVIDINRDLVREVGYPNQNRPFENSYILKKGFDKIKNSYFSSFQNFNSQFVGYLQRDKDQSRLALVNLMNAKSALSSMQEYFESIVDEQGSLLDEHKAIMMSEKENIELLEAACLYYKEHKPSKYFNKYTINTWYKAQKRDLMVNSELALSKLAEEFTITFPKTYYQEGVLKYYPIIAHELDVVNPQELIEFFYYCSSITTQDYNYLVIAIETGANEISPRGFNAPFEMLNIIKKVIDEDLEDESNNTMMPFPIDLDIQFLNCFDNEFNYTVIEESEYNGIDNIFELLWGYGKYREKIGSSLDDDYIGTIMLKKKEQILELLSKYIDKIPKVNYVQIENLCIETFSGKSFDDNDLNYMYEKLIAMDSNLD